MPSNSSIQLNPLIDMKTGIFCYLLEIESTKIVVDCGIDTSFSYSLYDPILNIISSSDCILLTSYELSHMGAISLFPHVPIYCTMPTSVLGRLVLEDYAHKFKVFLNKELKQIPEFNLIKFMQPLQIKDFEITAFNAGNCLGNSIFQIASGLESVVIGFNINHRRENYLDGINPNNFMNPSVFITNSVYPSAPSFNVKNRDEMILSKIRKCKGKIIIDVNYSRLVEILFILSEEQVLVVSRKAKTFIDRIKSMIEWAGSNANDYINEIKCNFGNVNDIDNYKIIIVVNEEECGYMGSIIERTNDLKLIMLLNSEKKDLILEDLKVYSFKSISIMNEPEISEENENIEVESSDQGDLDSHWNRHKKSVFIKENDTRKLFPYIKRKRYNNDYGEIVNFKFEAKAKEKDLNVENEHCEEEIEEAEFVKKGVNVSEDLEIFRMCFLGVSDFKSFKTIVESISPNKIVISSDNENNSKLLFGSFSHCREKSCYLLTNKPISLSAEFGVSKVILSETITNIRAQKIGKINAIRCLASNDDGLINFVDNLNPILFGTLNIGKIRKLLIERGFRVQIDGNSLIINNGLNLRIHDDEISVEGSNNNLVFSVVNTLFLLSSFV